MIKNKYWYILPLILTPCAVLMAYSIEHLGKLMIDQSLAPWLLITIVWCICWLIFTLCGVGLIFWGVGLICRVINVVLPKREKSTNWISASLAVDGKKYLVKDHAGDLYIAVYSVHGDKVFESTCDTNLNGISHIMVVD